MYLLLLILLFTIIQQTLSQQQQCGYQCAECNFLGECSQCENGFILNQQNTCQSVCKEKNFYLSLDDGQCLPICPFGFQESDTYYTCVSIQKCPIIREFGDSQKAINDSTLVGSEMVVFCSTGTSQQSFFLRIYDSNLQFVGELQQLSDKIQQYYLDSANNILITCSNSQINFWSVLTWKTLRTDLTSTYIPFVKYINYLDQNYLIIQDQSEKSFTVLSLFQATTNSLPLQFQTFSEPNQIGILTITRGINSIFYTVSSKPGFFERVLTSQNLGSTVNSYCTSYQATNSRITAIGDNQVLFSASNNNIGVWIRGFQCSTINIGSSQPISYFIIISSNPLYVIAAGSTNFYQLTSPDTIANLNVVANQNMQTSYYLKFALNYLYVRTLTSYSVYSYQNKSLIQILSGQSQSPDGQSFQNIWYSNNQIYEFYQQSMFISTPTNNQQTSSIQTYSLQQQQANLYYQQPTSINSILGIAIDPNYNGQLVIAGGDGSIRVYEQINDQALSFVEVLVQYHPSCNQLSFNQQCYAANNITISDLGYYYVIYATPGIANSVTQQFVTVWKRTSQKLIFVNDYKLTVNNINTIYTNYLLQQNYLLIQNPSQALIFDISANTLVVNITQSLFYVTFDQLWGKYMLIELLTDRVQIMPFGSTTAAYSALYSSLYSASSYYSSFAKAQYYPAKKMFAFNLYYYVYVFNFTNSTSVTKYYTYAASLKTFCYHSASGYTLLQNVAFKQLTVSDQKGNINIQSVISGYMRAYCGQTAQNIFYYYVMPTVAQYLNTVYITTMPNFMINHVISFDQTITFVNIDESKLILYVGFSNGDIYSTQIILNYQISLKNYVNVSQFIYTSKRNYFIIYQSTNVLVVDSRSLIVLKQFSTPNSNPYIIAFNEELEIIILYQQTQIIQWRISTGQLDQYPILHKTQITACYIDGINKILISQSTDFQIYVWNILTYTMIENISYHATDKSNIVNQQSYAAVTFSITQVLLLEDLNYIVSANSLNKIYIQDYIQQVYYTIQVSSSITLTNINYDIMYKYLYLMLYQTYAYADIYSWQQAPSMSNVFTFKKRVVGSQNMVLLNTYFSLQWSLIYETRTLTIIDRQQLTTSFVIDTFNPQIMGILIAQNLRQLIFWSNAFNGFSSPKVVIYSLDTGLKVNEVPYDQQTEQGMIINVIIDQNSNTLMIFKQNLPKVIIIFDLVNFTASGLFSPISDVYSIPLNNAIFVQETSILYIYSGTSITAYQIENMITPQKSCVSILPNRVKKYQYIQSQSLVFYDSWSQSWNFGVQSQTLKNIISMNSASYINSIKFFFLQNNFIFVLYKDRVQQINKTYQTQQLLLTEVDKALLVSSQIIISDYSGNISQFSSTDLSQIGSVTSVGARIYKIISNSNIQEIILQTYTSILYRFNYITSTLLQWFTPTTDTIYRTFFDSTNNILVITMVSGNCFLFDETKIQNSNPTNPIQNALSFPQQLTQITKIFFEPISGTVAALTIPPNQIPTIYFYTYVFTDATKTILSSLSLVGSIPSFSRSPLQKIMQYNTDLTQANMFRSTLLLTNVQKIINVPSPISSIALFFTEQESSIDLFSFQTTLIKLYTHSCVTPTLVDYSLSQTINGYYLMTILVLCNDMVISDEIYLQSLTSPLSQLNQCFIQSTTSYYYQMLQSLDSSFLEENANPLQIRIEVIISQSSYAYIIIINYQQQKQQQQSDYGDYTTQRQISYVTRNENSNAENILQLQQASYLDYYFEGLNIQNFSFDMSQLQGTLMFSSSVLNVALYQITLDFSKVSSSSPVPNSQILFSNMNQVIINQLLIQNVNLQRDVPLLSFTNVQEVVIDTLIINNLSITGQDSTILYFYGVQSLSIYNLKIQNLKVNVQAVPTLIFLEFVENFNMQNSQFGNINSVSQLEIIQIYGAKNTTLNGIIATSTKSTALISSYNYYQVSGTKVLISQNTANLNNVTVTNIQQLSNSFISFNQTSQVNIQSSNFQNIGCSQCTGGAVQIYQGEEHSINNCQFINISAQKGGALALLQCPSCQIQLLSSVFKLNSASIYGGAIYSENSNLVLTSTSVIQNSAMIGGGIKYTQIKPITTNTQRIIQEQQQSNLISLDEDNAIRNLESTSGGNTISNNVAQIYGNNIGSYLQKLQIIESQFQSLNLNTILSQFNPNEVSNSFVLSSYSLKNFRSGDSMNLMIQMLDEEDNPITFDKELVSASGYQSLLQTELQDIQIKVEPLDGTQLKVFGKYTSDYSQFDTASKSFIIEGLIIISDPQTSNIAKITSDSLVKIDPATRQIDEENTNLLYSLLYVQTRACGYGEVYQKIDTVYQCFVCSQGTYYLEIPTQDVNTCLKCPLIASQCYQNFVDLKSGYWRADNFTDNILSCYRNPNNCVPSEDTGYCISGHYGPLCEMCDVYGKIWGESYQTNGNYDCYPCSELQHRPYYTYLLLTLALILMIILISIASSLYNSKSIVLSYYMRRMSMASINKSAFWNSSCTAIKIFTNYLQISALIFTQLEFAFPLGSRYLSSTIGMPSTNMFYSLDCLFSKFHSMAIVYIRVIWALFIPILYFMGISIILIAYGYHRKQSIKTLLINGIVFLFFFTQNNIVYLILSMLSCREINNKFYIEIDISYECYTTSHLKFMMCIGIPGLIVWVGLIPYYLHKLLRRRQNELQFALFRQKFGYIYNDYKNEYYYWDFLKSFKQILVTAALTIYTYPVDNKIIFGLLVQLIYIMILTRKKPYLNTTFFNLEIFVEIMLIILFFVSIQMSSTSDSTEDNYLLNSYIITSAFTEGFMVFWIVKAFIKSKYFISYAKFKEWLFKYVPCAKYFSTYLKVQQGIKHLRIWKKLKTHLVGKQMVQYIEAYMSQFEKERLYSQTQGFPNLQDNLATAQAPLTTEGERVKGPGFQLNKYRQSIFEKQFPNQSASSLFIKSDFNSRLLMSPKAGTGTDEQSTLKDYFVPPSPQTALPYSPHLLGSKMLSSKPIETNDFQSSNNQVKDFNLQQIDLALQKSRKNSDTYFLSKTNNKIKEDILPVLNKLSSKDIQQANKNKNSELLLLQSCGHNKKYLNSLQQKVPSENEQIQELAESQDVSTEYKAVFNEENVEPQKPQQQSNTILNFIFENFIKQQKKSQIDHSHISEKKEESMNSIDEKIPSPNLKQTPISQQGDLTQLNQEQGIQESIFCDENAKVQDNNNEQLNNNADEHKIQITLAESSHVLPIQSSVIMNTQAVFQEEEIQEKNKVEQQNNNLQQTMQFQQNPSQSNPNLQNCTFQFDKEEAKSEPIGQSSMGVQYEQLQTQNHESKDIVIPNQQKEEKLIEFEEIEDEEFDDEF